MREINSHKVNGLNESLDVGVIDAPGNGGANHEYLVKMPENATLHQYAVDEGKSLLIPFQKGPIAENGVNGISNELLIAIVIDRLQCFQNGDYKCRENAIALTHLEDALHWLQHRTRQRVSRGVEGTSKV